MRPTIAALVLAAACCSAAAPAAAQGAARMLVMPFENPKRDARIFWLGEASAVLLADNLNALGVSAITRQERRQAFERLQVPPAASLTDATVIRISQLVGAGEAIVGTLHLDTDAGDLLVVRARVIALDTGRLIADVTERGPLSELFATFDRVARRLVSSPVRQPADEDRERPPVAAFENYIKGLLGETQDTAISYLNAALKIAPTYDRARLALWDTYVEQGDHARALAAVQPVPAASSSGRAARFLAGLSQLNLRKYEEAFTLFTGLADERATPTVLNNLGIVQLQRGSTPQHTGPPTYYFNKAAEADGDDPDYFFNLGYAYWQAHDTPAAVYWLREAVRRNAADGDAHYVLGAALAAAGNVTEAHRERELARRLSSTYEQWDRRPGAEAVPKGLERVKSEVELPHAQRIETGLMATGQRDQQELAHFYLERAQRLYQTENDRDAVSELNRALYLSPYLAEAHLLLGRIHLRNGRVREAVDALKISLWSADAAVAHLALAEAYQQLADTAAARAEAERALALDPSSTEARRVLDMLKSR